MFNTPQEVVRCMVLTTSDSRTLADDAGGAYLAETVNLLGHQLVDRCLVPDNIAAIRATVLNAVESGVVDVLLVTGGTSLAPRDVTPDAIVPLFSKRLSGFGEVFRQLSFDSIGPEAILSRADAGVITRTLVFILPGAPVACRLAMDKLIVPVLHHAMALLRSAD